MDRLSIVTDLTSLRDSIRQMLKYKESGFYRAGPCIFTRHGYGYYVGDIVYLNLGSVYTMARYRKTMTEMIEESKGFDQEVKMLRYKEAHAYVWALDSLRFRKYVNPNTHMSELADGSDSYQLISRHLDLPKTEKGPSILTEPEILCRIEALIIQNTYDKNPVDGEVSVSSLNKIFKESNNTINESKD